MDKAYFYLLRISRFNDRFPGLQNDPEGRAFVYFRAVNVQFAVMVGFYDTPAEGKPQPPAPLFGRVTGIEDVSLYGHGHSLSRIADIDTDLFVGKPVDGDVKLP